MAKKIVHSKILEKTKTVTGKRSLVVIEHLLKHGQITTEELEKYGYKHPPRAIRDVREQGVPLVRFWTKNSQGRKIAGYQFGDPDNIRNGRKGGRRAFSKKFADDLFKKHKNKCVICQAKHESRYLQIDHKIPYEISGDLVENKENHKDYMPLCASCNRAKSWSCEHCQNWLKIRDKNKCKSCYWGNPIHYTPVALEEIRRLEIVWQSGETDEYNKIKANDA